ncbi:MAG TPA: BNR-4 repeat-containing protein, partial [Candidatus Wallbacteria bacterium]|nr:BNR-4 repeat-containing protein [Candidatus Wallbacteria bacterium]
MDNFNYKLYTDSVYSENAKYFLLCAAIIAMILLGVGPAHSQQQDSTANNPYPTGWSSDMMVSYKAINAIRPEGVMDSKGNVHMVWEDNEDDIYYAQIDESGSLVVAQKPLTQTAFKDGKTSNYPSITSDRYGDLWAFWQDNRAGIYEIYFARSTDNGRTWSQEQRLTSADGMQSQRPRAHAKFYGESGRVYVTWQDRRTGNFEVFLRMISYNITDATINWGTDIQVTETDGF